MKVLIGILSYQGDAENGAHQAIRDTWGRDCAAFGADLRFFIGNRDADWMPKVPGEVLLNEHCLTFSREGQTDDEYCRSLKGNAYFQYLVREIYSYSVHNDYDFTFICCNDTFLIPRKLMACGFEKYDYSGYLLPRKGIHCSEDIPVGKKSVDDIPENVCGYPGLKLYLWACPGVGWFVSKKAARIIMCGEPDNRWGGDAYVGQLLGPYLESGYITGWDIENFWEEISWHYRTITRKTYEHDAEWMKMMYKEHGWGI